MVIQSYFFDGKNFVEASKFEGPLRNKFYIEGALLWTIGNKTISDLSYFDLIDQLWVYILQGVEQVENGNSWQTNFPGQPVKLSIEIMPRGMVTLKRSNSSDPDLAIVTQWLPLAKSLVEKGEAFFEVFSNFIDSATTREGYVLIARLNKKLERRDFKK